LIKIRSEFKPLDQTEKSGKHASVFFIEPSDPSQNPFASPTIAFSSQQASSKKKYAVKKQHLKLPDDPKDPAYRELRILNELNRLHKENKCFNFIKYYTFAKGSDMFPDEGESNEKERGTTRDEQYLYMVMEYASETLYERVKSGPLSIGAYKEILFQIVYTLAVAQETLQFVHNDLHMKNILLSKSLPSGTFCKYYDPRNNGTSWYLRRGEIVKLADFGLSRAELPGGELLCNDTNKSLAFISSTDVEKVAIEFSRVKMEVCIEDLIDEGIVSQISLSPEEATKLLSSKEAADLLKREKLLLSKLRKKMLDIVGSSISDLLHHQFFDKLKARPKKTLSCGSAAQSTPSLFQSPSYSAKKRYLLQASLNGVLPPPTPDTPADQISSPTNRVEQKQRGRENGSNKENSEPTPLPSSEKLKQLMSTSMENGRNAETESDLEESLMLKLGELSLSSPPRRRVTRSQTRSKK